MEKIDENQNTINELNEFTNASPEFPMTQEAEILSASSMEDLQTRLTSKEEEARSYHDKHLRLLAEFENFKRISQRDQRDHIRFANEGLLKEFLSVIDNLERAIKSGKDPAKGTGLLDGVELTYKQATELLEKFGVHPIPCVGKPFDPTCHQAVAQVESDTAPEHAVVEEFQRGYYLYDRVLRASMVAVAHPPTATNPGNTTAPEGQSD